MDKFCICIIGGGKFFETMHAPTIDTLDDIGRKVIVNPDKKYGEMIRQKWNYDAHYLDIDRALQTETIDCAYVITPHAVTKQYVVQLIKRGVPTFAEKPIAETLTDLMEIKYAYSRYGTPHQVGFNRRFSPIIRELANFISSTPDMSQLDVRFFRHNVRLPGDYMGSAIHAIDTIRFLCGNVRTIHTVISDTEYFDHGKIAYSSLFTFESGITGSLIFNCRAGYPSESYAAHTENVSATAELTMPSDVAWDKTLKIVSDQGETVLKDINLERDAPAENQNAPYFNGITQEHRYFLDKVRSGEAIPYNIDESIVTMKTAFAIRQCYSGDLRDFTLTD